MQIRFINKKHDMDQINEWLPFHVDAKDLPGHTFCAIVKDKIIAIAGFRLMEGELCFIDSMATDQSVEGAIRNEALDVLTKEILSMAKKLGFKKIFATTAYDCIVKRAEKHGFQVVEQKIIAREL